MRIEQLEQIITINRCASISKAAKELLISQPALSTSLRQLEEELGTTLFVRDHNGVYATGDGNCILELADQVMELVDDIRYFSCRDHDLQGTVRIMRTPAYSVLDYRILSQLRQQYPHLQVEIIEQSIDDVITGIADGAANVGLITWGISSEQTQAQLASLDLIHEELAPRKLMAFVDRHNDLADQASVSLTALQDAQFLSYSSGYWSRLSNDLHINQDAIIVKDKEDLKRGIYKGHAIALLPDIFAEEDIYCEQNLIRCIAVNDEHGSFEGYDCLLYPRKRNLTLAERYLLRVLRHLLTPDSPPPKD